MYPSTEMLISVQKYKLQYGKISPILSTQLITAPVKKYIYICLSVQNHKFQNKHIHRLCDYILQYTYSKNHLYNSTTIFIPVQKYKSQYINKSCSTKNLKKNGKKNITTVQQCVSHYRNINFSTKIKVSVQKNIFLKIWKKTGRYFIYDYYYVPKYIRLL